MIKGNLKSWKPGKGFERSFAHGVDLSNGVDSAFLIDGPRTSRMFIPANGGEMARDFSEIISLSCEVHLADVYGFTPDDIKEARRVGIGKVLKEKGERLCSCGCLEFEISKDRLEARRERGRAIRLKERSMKQSKSQTLV